MCLVGGIARARARGSPFNITVLFSLNNPTRPTTGTPWSGVDVRKRVYAVREPRSVATRFVTVDGRTVTSDTSYGLSWV